MLIFRFLSAFLLISVLVSAVPVDAKGEDCVGLVTADVVYRDVLIYEIDRATGPGYWVSGKVFVRDRGSRDEGISIKEYIRRNLPGAKIICISHGDSHTGGHGSNEVLYIFYTY